MKLLDQLLNSDLHMATETYEIVSGIVQRAGLQSWTNDSVGETRSREPHSAGLTIASP